MSMNTRILPASAWLVAIGAGAVLIIGAFARFDPASSAPPVIKSSPNPPPLAQDDPPPEKLEGEPALPAQLSPGLSEIIKLAQAHVDEGVILAYIQSSHLSFSPTADEILYLSDLGLSQDVIGALVKPAAPGAMPDNSQAIAATPTTGPAPPPTEPYSTTDVGTMTRRGGIGAPSLPTRSRQPTVVTIDPGWTPYVDAGQWLYSDNGWYWQSDYTWGWAAFHYGRWTKLPHQGWAWVPGNQWAPAWVAWSSAPSYIGWAPLPPGVSLNVLAQLTYNSKPIGPHTTLGAPAWAFSFVSVGNLVSRNLSRHVLPAAQAEDVARRSKLLDSYAIVNNRIFNKGINRDAVASATHKAVPEVTLRAVSNPEAAGLALDRKTLSVYLPPASSSGASSSGQWAANKSQVQARTEAPPKQDEAMYAENDPGDATAVPPEPANGDLSVRLPPLRYPDSSSPPAVHRHPRNVIIASPPNSMAGNRDWSPGYGAIAVEHPTAPAPAPRFDGFNPPVRQVEPQRVLTENRPAPVEPARAAPVVSASSSGSSKSGK